MFKTEINCQLFGLLLLLQAIKINLSKRRLGFKINFERVYVRPLSEIIDFSTAAAAVAYNRVCRILFYFSYRAELNLIPLDTKARKSRATAAIPNWDG